MDSKKIENSSILIVDDSPKNIQVVAGILEKEGFEMSFALNGKTALSLIESEKFDLILLDIMMPEISGYEVCKIIKQNPCAKHIPVIFLTAKTDSESIVKGFECGSIDYITKPFNPAELIARVRTHISLKQSKESLIKANMELTEINAAKNKFFSIIAHDLRNPFTALITGTELLFERIDIYEKKKIKELLKEINKSSRRTFGLLENLLYWSRSQTGSIKYNPEKIYIYTIISLNINLVKETAGLKEISIKNAVDKTISAYADLEMINTVIRNLLSNALKFTNKYGEISISSKEYEDIVEISIADNGVGINPRDIDKLFRIDVKHTTPGTEDETGSGLGLNICREFIEKNRGNIRVESQPGKGSVFYFTIPKS
ncbi:Signal transduction response regulator, receiver domain histidine kinase [Desulfonema limicola]|uniref:histidine kinase n=1 Tax=Desulfonema limicola TaxID=45656 RepID=A0A975BAY8_9BACT|nr:hybrid sensor histidine kinase/response regulator [Desulfonema limicola]QTA82279.1 Signal transduction response regulator, receiver domain histidine kinase [Desulfonema limicola]